MSNGEEPTTCAYQVTMTTPAVCSEAELASLQAQLRQLELFEQEVAAEIAAAAAAAKKDEL